MQLALDYKIEKFGEEDEKDIKIDSKQISQAVTWGTDWTVETLYNQLIKNNISLNPKFQRRNAWSLEKKSKLIESLILGLPVPEIILAEDKEKKGSYIVIDGKQRLLTIRHFYSNDNDELFPNYELRGLEILNKLNGKKYKDFEKDADYHQQKRSLDNQSIRTIIIKNWPNEKFLFTVFYRLNTGSVALSPQELRQALHPGPFLDFAEQFSQESKYVREMLHLKKPDERMRDTEMIIRHFAFKNDLSKYEGKLKEFLDESCEKLNDSWEQNENLIKEQAKELDQAINCTFEIFGKREAFSRYHQTKFQNKFNRGIYDIMAFYFSDPKIRKASLTKKVEIKEKFIELCHEDIDFLDSFGAGTKHIYKTIKRFSTWGCALSVILNMKIPIPKLKDGKIVLVNL